MMRPSIRSMAHLAWIRTSEQPMRLLYLVATLAVATLAWIVLSAFSAPFLASRVGNAISAELTVANARIQTSTFPLRHALRMENMPGVAAVSYFNLASLPCGEGRGTLSINAYGGSGVDAWLRGRGTSPQLLDSWRSTGNGLLVGAETAQRCGLVPGMSLSPTDYLSGVEIPITIIAILPDAGGGMGDRIAYGHYDYFNRLLPEELRDQVMRARVVGDDPATLPALAQMIDEAFSSSDPPLQANTSSSADSALGRFGQVQSLLGLIMAAMGACAVLVFVTVLAHLLAQRRPSMAVLQTLGFSRRIQFGALLIEMSAVIAVGALTGVAAGQALLAVLNPRVSWLLGQLRTPDWALLWLPPALLVLAIIALAWPSMQIRGLRPIDHLRT